MARFQSADKKNAVKKTSKAIPFQALEQRLLLDGAAVSTMADAISVNDMQSELELAAAQVAGPKDDSAAIVDHKAQVQEFEGLAVAASTSNEVVFIDGSVPNAGDLLSNISPTADVYFINTDTDGVSQIADVLKNYSDIDSLHIVSHGEQGSLDLGSTQLNQQNMQSEYAEELTAIGDALSESGDILIYGCDFAQGTEGTAASQVLASLTGANIAASVDDTGAESKGGDWELEHQTGSVESRTIQALGFAGILADTDGDGVDDSDDIDDDNDGILDSVENGELSDTPVNFTGLDNTGGTYNANTSGTAVVGVTVSAGVVTAAPGDDTAGGISASTGGGSGGGIRFEDPKASTAGTKVNANLTFDMATNFRLAADTSSDTVLTDGPSGNVNNSDADLIRFTVVGASADFDWNFNISNIFDDNSDSTFSISGDTLTLDLGTPTGTSVGYDFTVIGEAMGIEIEYETTTSLANQLNSHQFAVFTDVLVDTDGDGVYDAYDLDSDNDGISDLYESGPTAANIAADTNADGTISLVESAAITLASGDADGDGLMDIFDADTADSSDAASVGSVPVDNDTDLTPDYLDLDSDNDGIADTIEARPTTGYVANDGDVTDNDVDGDGVIDIFDSNDGSTGEFGGTHANFNNPINTDGDSAPDYLDDDSDDDVKLDSAESGLGATTDATYADPDGSVSITSADLDNENGDLTEVGFRESAIGLIGLAKQQSSAVPNGDDFDVTFTLNWENTGALALDNVEVFDNIALQFESQFVGIVPGSLSVSNFSGTGLAPTANAAYETDTTQSLVTSSGVINPGDSFQVIFTATVDVDNSFALGDNLSGLNYIFDVTAEDGIDFLSAQPLSNLIDGSVGSDSQYTAVLFDGDGSNVPSVIPDDGHTYTFTLTEEIEEITGFIIDNDRGVIDSGVDGITLEFFSGSTSLGTDNFNVAAQSATQTFGGFSYANVTSVEVTVTSVHGTAGSQGTTEQYQWREFQFIGTPSSNLVNQAFSTGEAINVNGDAIVDADGDPVRTIDYSDDGTNPAAENDPTPIIIPDISVVKEIVGTPVQQADGTFAVTYEVLVDNSGNVDVTGLSVVEDLATEFGSAFASASNLRFGTLTSDAGSSIVLDANWDGDGNSEFIDNSAGTILQSLDSFTVLFDVIINPTSSALDNQVTASGTAVDEIGNALTDPTGAPLVATDDSDSGADPDGTNAGESGDTGGEDDSTPLYLPAIGVAKQAGDAIANGNFYDIEFTLVWENTGNVALDSVEILDDIATQFGAEFVGVSTVTVQNFTGTGSVPMANSAWNTSSTTDSLVTGTGALEAGDTFEVVFTVTIDPAVNSTGLANQATSSGEALDANGNPILNDSGDPVTGDDVSDNGTDPTSENGEDNGDGTFGNDPTPILMADLVTVKVLDSIDSTPEEGATVTFQISVDNTGAAQATNVSLTDLLPAGLTATANNGLVSQGSYDAVTGIWAVGTLADGDTATLTLEGTVNVGQSGNTISNITTAATGTQIDPGTAGDDLNESVVVDPNADLVTVKTLTSGDSTPAEGETVTFQISVDNAGAAQATGVSLTDVLPAGLTATANNGTASVGTYDSATGIWAVGTLANGGSAALTLEGIVDAAEGGNTIINVTTAATADQPDPSTAGDDLDESVQVLNDFPVVIDPDLTLGTPSIDPLNAANIVVPAIDGEPITIDLDDYLTDPNGHPLTITPGTLPPGATFDSVANELTFIPTVDNDGNTVITFTVDDGNGGLITPTVTITPVNPGPDAIDETITGTFDTPILIDPLFNDTDPDGDALTITAIDGVTLTPGVAQTILVTNGSVAVATDGAITVTPDTGFSGDIDVPYTITDVDGATATATHTVEVPNAPPAVVDPDLAVGTPSIDPLDPLNILVPAVDGTSVSIDLDDYLADPNSDTLTITPGTLPAGASFNSVTNVVTFTPAVDNVGDTVIPFTVTDSNGGTIAPTITIQPVNPAPDAIDQKVAGVFETPIVIDLLGNDVDPDGDALTITSINGVTLTPGVAQTLGVPNGTLTVAIDGTITLIPNAGFSGNIDVPYSIEDIDGATDTAIHTVAVSNVPPVVVDPVSTPGTPSIDPLDSENILVPAVDGTPVSIDLDDYLNDSNSDALTITPGTLPAGVAFDPVSNIVSFTPSVDNVGDTVIPFTVTDNNGGTITPTVTIQPVNPGPDAIDQTVAGMFETAIVIDLTDNDTDPDGDAISVTAINGVALTPGTAQTIPVTNGSVEVATDGTTTVIPDAGFSGDINVPYTITDVDGATDSATHTVEVPNAPPAVVDPNLASGTPSVDPSDPQNILVPAVDGIPVSIDLDDYLTDPNGDTLTITPGALPPGVTFDPVSNIVSFTPSVDNVGDTVIQFTVTDSNGGTITPTVTIQPVNLAPDAANQTVVGAFETPTTIDPLSNDTDPDGDALTITTINGVALIPGAEQSIPVLNGVVNVASDGTITVTPDTGYSGDIDVPYRIEDADGATDTALMTVEVPNAPPVVVDSDLTGGTPSIDPLDATNIVVPAIDGTPVSIDLDDYLTDPNNDSLTITPGTLPAGATFNSVTRVVTFTPSIDNVGDTVIPFTVTDNNGGTVTPTVTFQPVNPGPDAIDQTVDGTFESTTEIDLLANDTDPDGDTLIISSINGVVLTPGVVQTIAVIDGSLTIDADGSVTITPDAGFTGTMEVPYTIVDGDGATDTAIHTVVVPNVAPVAVDQTVAGAFEAALVIDPLANDTDPDGDTLSISSINGVALTAGTPQVIAVTNGSVTIDANGVITVTPDAGFSGPIDMPYTIVDEDGATAAATHTVEIPNAPPVVVDPNPEVGTPSIDPLDPQNIVVPAIDGSAVTVDLNDYLADSNGDVLSITPGVLPTGATFDPVTNQLTFVPSINNVGNTVIMFTATDGNGGTITPTVSIQPVNPLPDANDETVVTAFETPVEIDLLGNDTDTDGDQLTITSINSIPLAQGVTHAISIPNGTVSVAVDGTITVIPDSGFSGDIIVPYSIVDEDGATDTAIHTVEVANAPPAIVDPVSEHGSPSIDPSNPQNLLVPAVDSTLVTIDLNKYLVDPNGEALTITPSALPPGATFDPLTNEVTFIPSVDNVGDTVIAFTVTDSSGGTTNTSITIQPVNPAPIAVDERQAGSAGAVVIDPLAGDIDPDNDTLIVTSINGSALTPGVAQTITVPNGVVTVSVDGIITVTPNVGFTGDIAVPYTIADGDGGTDSAIHTVEFVNVPPAVVIESPQPGEPLVDPTNSQNILVPAVDGESITIDLDDYLIDPNGDPITINAASLPPGATFNPVTNELTFVPAPDNNGETIVPLTVTDSAGNVITPTITIQPVNPAPIANPETVVAAYGEVVTVDLLGNDTDPDGDPLSLVGAPMLLDPASGTLALIGEDWVFTPAAGFSGDVVIRYSLQDQDGTTATSVHTVSIAAPSVAAALEFMPINSSLVPDRNLTAVAGTEYQREFYEPEVDTELVILDMTDGLQSLNTTLLSDGAGLSNGVNADQPLSDLTEIAYGETGGFSSGKGYRGTHSVDPTDKCGRFFVDTIVSDGMLSITARSTIHMTRSDGVVAFSATLANGKPLPAWISEVADGEYLIDRSVDLETVAIKLVAHRESGTVLTRNIEIDTLTGLVREQQQTSTFSSSFYDVLEQDASNDDPKAVTLTQ